MKKIIVSILLFINFVSPASAEEVGGWAVVNPETNQVHGVIVCTESVCGSEGSWGGVLPGEYMGCTDCNLVLQTDASEDGNVAGYSGENVTYNPETEDFSVKNNYQTDEGSVEQEIIVKPKSKTSSIQPKVENEVVEEPTNDVVEQNKTIDTNIVKKTTKLKSEEVNEQTVSVNVVEDLSDTKNIVEDVEVKYDQWNNGTSFFYDSKDELLTNIDSDIESVFTPCNTCNVDPVKVEEYRNTFYDTITTLTQKVKNFINSLFGGVA